MKKADIEKQVAELGKPKEAMILRGIMHLIDEQKKADNKRILELEARIATLEKKVEKKVRSLPSGSTRYR